MFRIHDQIHGSHMQQTDKNTKTVCSCCMQHWAAELNHIEVAELLLDYSIDPAATECNGR